MNSEEYEVKSDKLLKILISIIDKYKENNNRTIEEEYLKTVLKSILDNVEYIKFLKNKDLEKYSHYSWYSARAVYEITLRLDYIFYHVDDIEKNLWKEYVSYYKGLFDELKIIEDKEEIQLQFKKFNKKWFETKQSIQLSDSRMGDFTLFTLKDWIKSENSIVKNSFWDGLEFIDLDNYYLYYRKLSEFIHNPVFNSNHYVKLNISTVRSIILTSVLFIIFILNNKVNLYTEKKIKEEFEKIMI